MSSPISTHHLESRELSRFSRVERLALLALGFILRTLTLTAQGLWRDEVDQWRFAFQPLREQLLNFTRPGWNGPLYSPLLRGWIALAGDSVFSLRFLSVLWALLGLALTYALFSRVLGRSAARWTLWLSVFSPYLVYYAQEVKMYTWVPLLVMLALYALDRACVATRPRAAAGWWALVLVASSFAFYSHILAALLIPVEVAWFTLHPRRRRRTWIGALIVLLLLTLPYLPLLLWQAGFLFQQRQTGYPDYTLGQMLTVLLNGWSAGISPGRWSPRWLHISLMTSFALTAVAGAASLLAPLRACRADRSRRLAQLLAWLLLPVGFVWLVSLTGPIFTDRYLVWTAPAFYALVAAGIAALRRWGRWLPLIPLVLMLASSGAALVAQAATPLKPRFDLAVELVSARRAPDSALLFQIPHNRYVYDYYAREPFDPWFEAPYTNWRNPDGSYQVAGLWTGETLRDLIGAFDDIWLVYSEPALWDERQLVREWLGLNYTLRLHRSFPGVEVYQYVK